MAAGIIKLNRDDHILVLEDPAQVSRSVEQALAAEGYINVEAASTEDEVVALAQRRRPDVLILNQRAGMSREAELGLAETGARISERARLEGVPVIRLGLGSVE